MPSQGKRRSLSNVGGRVEVRGDPSFGFVLRRALEAADEAPDDRLTHGFHVYPARMHPAVARTVLEEFQALGGQEVLDPLCGGGTVPVEAMRGGWRCLGADLNPLALRVSRTRCELRPQRARDRFVDAVERVGAASTRRVRGRVPIRAALPEDLRSRHPVHVLKELAGLLVEIRRCGSEADREAMEMVFSSIVVKCSTQRADTDTREETKRLRKGLCTELFVRKGRELASRWASLSRAVSRGAHRPRFVASDVRRLTQTLGGQYRCDLVLTSPPYGGTYDYVEHHRLRAAWLGVGLKEMERAELGARRRLSDVASTDAPTSQRVARWDDEVLGMLENLAGCMRPEAMAVFMMGDGEVGGVRVPADEQLERLAPQADLRFVCAATQPRVDMRGGAGRAEHLVALTRH